MKIKKGISWLLVLCMIVSMGLFGYSGYTYANQQVQMIFMYVLFGGILIIALLETMHLLINIKKNASSWIGIFIGMAMIGFMVVLTGTFEDYVVFHKQETMPYFYQASITDVNEWGKMHNISIYATYENSDMMDKNTIMVQSVESGVLLKDIKEVSVVVSDGPNYDKEVVVSKMIGWNLDDVLTYINKNFMNNVTLSFEESEEDQFVVIEQSRYGEMYRRDPLEIKISYGNKSTIPETLMENLVGMSQFEATLWLNRNAIPYKIKTAFSEEVERGKVLDQSIQVNTEVNQTTLVDLTLSKGKEISVLDLVHMSVADITTWAVDNNLRLKFSEEYDDTIPLGSVITANYKEGDIIEESTTVKIKTSKGQLKMEKFTSVVEFKSWCSTYDILYSIKKVYSDTVSSGKIISFSVKEGEIIKNGATITVTISKGKAVEVPNFIGMNKSEIKEKCNSMNLSCSFVYGSYSSKVAKDVAISQSIAAGNKIEEGSSITITLSKGKPKTYTLMFSAALLGTSYNSTKNSLESYFEKNYPGVIFKFVAKADNSLSAGQIHGSSPTKPGMKVTQGNTYTIWIVK